MKTLKSESMVRYHLATGGTLRINGTKVELIKDGKVIRYVEWDVFFKLYNAGEIEEGETKPVEAA